MHSRNPDVLGGWRLVRAGVLLLFLTTVSGFLIPITPDKLLGVVAHVHTLLNGVLLLLLGLVWPRLVMHVGTSALATTALIVSSCAFVITFWVCAFLEIGGTMFPVAFAGHTGTPMQELTIKIVTIGASILTIYGVGVAAYSSFRSSGL